MTQPYALYIADIVEDAGKPADIAEKAAAELRRLHAENEALREANEAFGKRQEWWNERMFVLEQQRDVLLEALKNIEKSTHDTMTATLARVALAKTEENT